MKEEIIEGLRKKVEQCKEKVEKERQLTLHYSNLYGNVWENKKSRKHLEEKFRQERLVTYYTNMINGITL